MDVSEGVRSQVLELEISRIDLLYKQNTFGMIGVLANTAVVLGIGWNTLPRGPLLIWSGTLIASTVARFFLARRWNKIKHQILRFSDIRQWTRYIVFCLSLSGIGWGLAGAESVLLHALPLMFVSGAFIFGMSAGALATYSSSLPAMYSVLYPATIPWIAVLVISKDTPLVLVGVSSLLFLVMMTRIGRNLNHYVRRSLELTADLKINQERLRLARDSSQAVSWEWDIPNDLFTIEGDSAGLFGVACEESGQLAEVFKQIPFDQPEIAEGGFRQKLLQGPLDMEAPLTCPDGSRRWIAIRGSTQLDRQNRPLRAAGICWDVTTKKSAENLRHEKEVLLAANKAKSVFLANVSHEIRTPLSAINGFTETLLEDSRLPEPLRDLTRVILRNGNYMASLVSDLLDLSKSESDELFIQCTTISPMREIQDTLMVVQAQARRKNLNLQVAADGLLPETIQADATRLRQILINLLTNAVKYTNEGSITVRVSCDATNPDRGIFRVLIIDTGIGISDEIQPLLFQPFSRGKAESVRSTPGSGLGLALSRRLARSMGGDLKLVSSRVGEGSVFEVTLSTGSLIGVEFSPSGELHSLPLTRQRLQRRNILLVEDDQDLSELMVGFLTSHGARVDTASDGEEGVSMALSNPYDLILMDIKMPRLDGDRATLLLREHGHRGLIVAITAHASLLDREFCFRSGFDSYLQKPINRQGLLELIDKQFAKTNAGRA